jgi:hypothetical protein
MKNKEKKFLFASGTLFGIAVLTKYISGFYIIFFVITFLMRKMKKQLIEFFIFFVLPFIPWFLFYWIQFSNPFYPLIENFSETFSKPFGEWYTMLQYMPTVFGIGIFLVLLSPKKNDKTQNIFLATIVLFLLTFSLLSHREPRYLLVLTSMVAITIANGLISLKKGIGIVLVILLLVSLRQLYFFQLKPETFYNVSSLLYNLKGKILTTDSPLVSFTLKRNVSQILMFKLIDPCEDVKNYDIDWVFFSTREDWFKENEAFYLKKLDSCTTKIKELNFGFEKYYLFKTKKQS